MSPLLPRFVVLSVCLAGSFGSLLRAAETPAPASEAVVQLPRFVVEDKRLLPSQESWDYVSTTGVEILSSISEAKLRLVLREIDRAQQLVAHLWPSLLNVGGTRPTTLFLSDQVPVFGDFVSASHKQGTLVYNQLHKRGPQGAFLVVDFTKVQDDQVFVEQQKYLAHDPDARRFGEMYPSQEASSSTSSGETEAAPPDSSPHFEYDGVRAAEDAYLRALLSQSGSGAEGRLPEWFVEGMVRVLRAVEFDRDSFVVGRLESTGIDRVFALEKLFAGLAQSGEPEDAWGGQAHTFVHLCLFGERLKYRKAFVQWVELLRRQPPSEELFKRFFGIGMKDMTEELRAYRYHRRYKVNELRDSQKPLYVERPLPEIRKATWSEVGRLRGEAFCVIGEEKRGLAFMLGPFSGGSRDAELLASLGLAELRGGRQERARSFLAAAVQAGTRRGEAYLELARDRMDQAMAGRNGAKPGRDTMDLVLPCLRSGLKAQPAFFDLSDFTVCLMLEAGHKPSPEDFQLLLSASQGHLQRLKHVYGLARLALMAGYRDEARSLVERGLQLVGEGKGRGLFLELRAQLEAR